MDLRYPVGRFVWDKDRAPLTGEERGSLIDQIVAHITSLRDRMGWSA